MSVRLWIGLGLFAVLMLGFSRIRSAISRQLHERQEVESFAEVFGRYMHSGGDDHEAYGYLIERSNRVQEILGPVGIMAHFIAPFQCVHRSELLNHFERPIGNEA